MQENNRPAHGFWERYTDIVYNKMIPLQLEILNDRAPDTEPSHAVENFRIAAGLAEGEFHGMVFQDSDVGKWMEAAAYKLKRRPDPALEKEVDDLVDLIALAQGEDGYLDTYFTVKEPENRWKNLCECHELYCFGHLTEAAVAYYEATGKDKFLNVMRKMADLVCTVLGPGEGQIPGYPGHPEAEIALYRLYKATGEQKYLDECGYFLKQRGQTPNIFVEQWEARGRSSFWNPNNHSRIDLSYHQAHKPLDQQDEAVGHSVRALYLYTGMALYAKETGDQELLAACNRLWENLVTKKMYITGGLGSTAQGEAFMGAYELPNDTVYAETCASIAMCFFGKAMWKLHRDGAIDDVIERELYNTVLASISLAGDRFFYVNPLEVNPGVSGVQQGHQHVLPQRPKWFACACCPPNVARLLADLPSYCWEENEGEIVAHQYLAGKTSLRQAEISLKTDYPYDGALSFTVEAKKPFTLYLRVPAYAPAQGFAVNGEARPLPEMQKGFVRLELAEGTTRVDLGLALKPIKWYANENVRADAGQVAFSYGPLVYCFETADNRGPLHSCKIDPDAEIRLNPYDPALLGGVRTLTVKGRIRKSTQGALYTAEKPVYEDITLTAIPYYAWGNRSLNEMRVWMRE